MCVYFDDFVNLGDLEKIDWNAVKAKDWRNCKEQKQAEFLIEKRFPWRLIEGIGTYSLEWADKASSIIATSEHKPPIKPKPGWYY